MPLAVLGLMFEDQIKAVLFNPVSVAIALVVGGVIILWAERRKHEERVQTSTSSRRMDAVKLGLFQALALIPGTSRSGATIIGGLLCGLSRRTAAEFSFFVAHSGAAGRHRARHLQGARTSSRPRTSSRWS